MAVATAPRRAAAPATVTATAYDERDHAKSPVVVGAALAVVADAMVLGGLLAAYFGLRASSFEWPPKGVSHGTYLPAVITLTVLMGVASVQWAAYALRRGDRRNCLIGLAMTMTFGLAIANGEWYGFGRSGFGISKHAYGTLHDALIGFHLVNVLVAVVLLGVVFVHALAGASDDDRPGAVQAIALFWHFTTVAWLVIFSILYLAT
jgi:heme/copper-type cytochrome/quinol oxidase subunit 3